MLWISSFHFYANYTIISLLCLVSQWTKQFHSTTNFQRGGSSKGKKHFWTHNISLKWRSKLFSHFLITHIPFSNFINLLRIQRCHKYCYLQNFSFLFEDLHWILLKLTFFKPWQQTIHTNYTHKRVVVVVRSSYETEKI